MQQISTLRSSPAMQKTAQLSFTGGGVSGEAQQKPVTSLLADWNSYSTSRPPSYDKVSSTFSAVSKGVREIPWSLQRATSSVPSGKALVYFWMLLGSGVFVIFIALVMFLPVMVLIPQKFAICFTSGCGFILCAWGTKESA